MDILSGPEEKGRSHPSPVPENSDQVIQSVSPLNEGGRLTSASTTLGQTIVEALKALNTLNRQALAESTARHEAELQINLLAQGISGLAEQSLTTPGLDSDMQEAWQFLLTELAELASPLAEEVDVDEEPVDEALNLSEQEISRRLGVLEARHQPATIPESNVLRRVLVASLESGEDIPGLVNTAAASFSNLTWSVTNLGNNVPMLTLRGNVMETRPSVVVLVMAQGRLLDETARLTTDLKRQLFGLRIVAVGPALTDPDLAERLKVDVYSNGPEKASAICDQLLNPLPRG